MKWWHGKKHQYMGVQIPYVLAALLGLGLITSGQRVEANASSEDVQEIVEACMLSNRMLKNYALIGMGVVYQDPVADLQAGMVEMSMYMSNGALASQGLKEELGNSLRKLDQDWKGIEPLLTNTPSKASVLDLRIKIENFSKKCEIVVEALAIDTQIEGEQDLVLTAKLGMEVQRLAALYMIEAWGAEQPQYYSEVDKIKSQFKTNYEQLTETENTIGSKELKKALKKLDNQFLVFGFLASSKSGRFQPTRAEKISEDVFYEVRDILILEEELLQ
jgi:hypothetical protein